MRKSPGMLLAGIVALAVLSSQAWAIDIQPTFTTDYTAEQKACAEAAIKEWEDWLVDSYTFESVTFEIGSDVGGALAGTLVSALMPASVLPGGWQGMTPTYSPWDEAVSIRIQLNVAYISQMTFAAGSPVPSDKYDALTIFRHELCHGLGFNEWYSDFDDRLTDGPGGNRTYNGDSFTVVLTGTSLGTHMADANYAGDLMEPTLGKGVRKEISEIDLAILSDAFGYNVVPEPAGVLLLGLGLFGPLWVAVRRRAA